MALRIKDSVDLKELEKYGFIKSNNWGWIFYPNNNNPNTRYFSSIKIDRNNRSICFDLENMSWWCNDLEQLELDIENIKNSYIAFKQKVKELLEADLIIEVEE